MVTMLVTLSPGVVVFQFFLSILVFVTNGKNGICYELTNLTGEKQKNDVLTKEKNGRIGSRFSHEVTYEHPQRI